MPSPRPAQSAVNPIAQTLTDAELYALEFTRANKLERENANLRKRINLEKRDHADTTGRYKRALNLAVDRRESLDRLSLEIAKLEKILAAVGKERGVECPKCRTTCLALEGAFSDLCDAELEIALNSGASSDFDACDADGCFGGFVVEAGE